MSESSGSYRTAFQATLHQWFCTATACPGHDRGPGRPALREAPLLAYPDAQEAFIVDTDASNVGVGDTVTP